MTLDPEDLEDLEAWRSALAGSFSEIVRFLISRDDDRAAVERTLRELLTDTSLASGIGKAILALPSTSRARILPFAVTHARPEVRRALFREWAPERLEVPRERSALVPEPLWTDILRAALADDDRAVRTAATALVFDSDRGGTLVPELLANLDEPDPDLRWRTLLALGAARDAESRARLEETVRTGSDALAGAAVRALAARPDGRAVWRAALEDAREGVRASARFALARVVERRR